MIKWLAGFVVSTCLLAQCWADWHSQTESIMGTEVSVTLWANTPQQANNAIQAVMTDMHRIDQQYSPYIETSELSKLNRDAVSGAVVVSDELFFMLEQAIAMGHKTQGAFDITYASLGWHYDYRANKQPSADKIKALLPAINFRWIELNPAKNSVQFLHKNVRVDLGGIAKGFAVDRAVQLLKKLSISHASVSAGGDSRLLGDRRGRPWLVGIKHPRPLKNTSSAQNSKPPVALTLPLSDTAISTSGDYERYFIDDKGARIHHIINPRTGRSADSMMSVTILGVQGIETDALSTSVFVLGVTKGLALINALQGVDCIIIDRSGKVFYSKGLQDPAAS